MVDLSQAYVDFPTSTTAKPFGQITDYGKAMAALPGLLAFHQVSAAACTPDGSNRVASYTPAAGSGAFIEGTAGQQPLYVPGRLNGRDGLYFSGDSARRDVMSWAGSFPTGLGCEFTEWALIQPDPGLNGHIGHVLSLQAATANRHDLYCRADQLAVNQVSSGVSAVSPNTQPMSYLNGNVYLLLATFDGRPGGSGNIGTISINSQAPTVATGAGVPGSSGLILGGFDAAGTNSTFAGHVFASGLLNLNAYNQSSLAGFQAFLLQFALDEYGVTLNY